MSDAGIKSELGSPGANTPDKSKVSSPGKKSTSTLPPLPPAGQRPSDHVGKPSGTEPPPQATAPNNEPLKMDIVQVKATGGDDAARTAAATEAHIRKQEHARGKIDQAPIEGKNKFTRGVKTIVRTIDKHAHRDTPIDGNKLTRAGKIAGRVAEKVAVEMVLHPVKTSARMYETIALRAAIERKTERLTLEINATLGTEGQALPKVFRDLLQAKAQEMQAQRDAERQGLKEWAKDKTIKAGKILAGERTAITQDELNLVRELRRAAMVTPDQPTKDPKLATFIAENGQLINAYKDLLSGRFDAKQALMESANIRQELGEIAPGHKLGAENAKTLAEIALIPIAEKLSAFGSGITPDAKIALKLEAEHLYLEAIAKMPPGVDKDRLVANMAVAQNIFATAEALAQSAEAALPHVEGETNINDLKDFFTSRTDNLTVTVTEITDESLAEIKRRRAKATDKAVKDYLSSGGVGEFLNSEDPKALNRAALIQTGKTLVVGGTAGSIIVVAGQRTAGYFVRRLTSAFGGVTVFAGVAGARQGKDTGRDIAAARTAMAQGAGLGEKGGKIAEIAGMSMISLKETASRLDSALTFLQKETTPTQDVIANAFRELAAVDARRRVGDSDKVGMPLWYTDKDSNFNEEMKGVDVKRAQIIGELRNISLDQLQTLAKEIGVTVAGDTNEYIDAIKSKLADALQDNIETKQQFSAEVASVLNGEEVKTSVKEARRAALKQQIISGTKRGLLTMVVGDAMAGGILIGAEFANNGSVPVEGEHLTMKGASTETPQVTQQVATTAAFRPQLTTSIQSSLTDGGLPNPNPNLPDLPDLPDPRGDVMQGAGAALGEKPTVDSILDALPSKEPLDPGAHLEHLQTPDGHSIEYPGKIHLGPDNIILDESNHPIPHQADLRAFDQIPGSKNFVLTYDPRGADGAGAWDAVDPKTDTTAIENIHLNSEGKLDMTPTKHFEEQTFDLPKPDQLPGAETATPLSSEEIVSAHSTDIELHFNTRDSGGQGFRTAAIDDGNGIKFSYIGTNPDAYTFTVNGETMVVPADSHGNLELHFDSDQTIKFANGTEMPMKDFSALFIDQPTFHNYIDGLGVKNGGIGTEMHPGGRDVFNVEYIRAATVTEHDGKTVVTSLATIQGDGKLPAEFTPHAELPTGSIPAPELQFESGENSFTLNGQVFEYPGGAHINPETGSLLSNNGDTVIFSQMELAQLSQLHLPPNGDYVFHFDQHSSPSAWDLVNTKQGLTYVENIYIDESTNQLHFTPTIFGDVKDGHFVPTPDDTQGDLPIHPGSSEHPHIPGTSIPLPHLPHLGSVPLISELMDINQEFATRYGPLLAVAGGLTIAALWLRNRRRIGRTAANMPPVRGLPASTPPRVSPPLPAAPPPATPFASPQEAARTAAPTTETFVQRRQDAVNILGREPTRTEELLIGANGGPVVAVLAQAGITNPNITSPLTTREFAEQYEQVRLRLPGQRALTPGEYDILYRGGSIEHILALAAQQEYDRTRIYSLQDFFEDIEGEVDPTQPYFVQTINPNFSITAANADTYSLTVPMFIPSRIFPPPALEINPRVGQFVLDLEHTSTRFDTGERFTGGDSGLVGLIAASAPDALTQAELYKTIGLDILSIHSSKPYLFYDWLLAQNTPPGDPTNCLAMMIGFDYDATGILKPPDERLFHDAADNLLLNDPYAFNNLWADRQYKLFIHLRNGTLTANESRWLEALSHSVKVPELLNQRRGGTPPPPPPGPQPRPGPGPGPQPRPRPRPRPTSPPPVPPSPPVLPPSGERVGAAENRDRVQDINDINPGEQVNIGNQTFIVQRVENGIVYGSTVDARMRPASMAMEDFYRILVPTAAAEFDSRPRAQTTQPAQPVTTENADRPIAGTVSEQIGATLGGFGELMKNIAPRVAAQQQRIQEVHQLLQYNTTSTTLSNLILHAFEPGQTMEQTLEAAGIPAPFPGRTLELSMPGRDSATYIITNVENGQISYTGPVQEAQMPLAEFQTHLSPPANEATKNDITIEELQANISDFDNFTDVFDDTQWERVVNSVSQRLPDFITQASENIPRDRVINMIYDFVELDETDHPDIDEAIMTVAEDLVTNRLASFNFASDEIQEEAHDAASSILADFSVAQAGEYFNLENPTAEDLRYATIAADFVLQFYARIPEISAPSQPEPAQPPVRPDDEITQTLRPVAVNTPQFQEERQRIIGRVTSEVLHNFTPLEARVVDNIITTFADPNERYQNVLNLTQQLAASGQPNTVIINGQRQRIFASGTASDLGLEAMPSPNEFMIICVPDSNTEMATAYPLQGFLGAIQAENENPPTIDETEYRQTLVAVQQQIIELPNFTGIHYDDPDESGDWEEIKQTVSQGLPRYMDALDHEVITEFQEVNYFVENYDITLPRNSISDDLRTRANQIVADNITQSDLDPETSEMAQTVVTELLAGFAVDPDQNIMNPNTLHHADIIVQYLLQFYVPSDEATADEQHSPSTETATHEPTPGTGSAAPPPTSSSTVKIANETAAHAADLGERGNIEAITQIITEMKFNFCQATVSNYKWEGLKQAITTKLPEIIATFVESGFDRNTVTTLFRDVSLSLASREESDPPPPETAMNQANIVLDSYLKSKFNEEFPRGLNHKNPLRESITAEFARILDKNQITTELETQEAALHYLIQFYVSTPVDIESPTVEPPPSATISGIPPNDGATEPALKHLFPTGITQETIRKTIPLLTQLAQELDVPMTTLTTIQSALVTTLSRVILNPEERSDTIHRLAQSIEASDTNPKDNLVNVDGATYELRGISIPPGELNDPQNVLVRVKNLSTDKTIMWNLRDFLNKLPLAPKN